MKQLIWGLIAIIIAGGIMLEFRYEVKINTPIVAKIDRFTGETWIANSGVWKKVQHENATPKETSAKSTAPGKAAK